MLTTPIRALVIKSVSLYERLLGPTVLDALAHFPVNLIEKVRVTELNPDLVGQHITAVVEPIQHVPPPRRGGPYKILCSVKPSGNVLELVFFYKRMSTKFLTFTFAVGRPKFITGKLERFGDLYKITHPLTGNQATNNPSKAPLREVIYPQIAGLFSARIHTFIQYLIQNLQAPLEWHRPHDMYPSFLKAVELVHNPQKLEDVLTRDSLSYQRLLHDELLAQQVALMITRRQTKNLQGVKITPRSTLYTQIKARLPFSLTQGQEEALQAIETDMASSQPMLRLVQGDVGCGKTIVAALAMANVLEQGYQAAVLAPTDILSAQHFVTFSDVFKETGYTVELLTGKITGKKRKRILEKLEQGEIHILIGTHALLQDPITFQNLAFVVIDEQHRFGVAQRARLTEKGVTPHLLSMTATPIPRTLQMALCGDLDVTSILEKPAGRKNIITSLHSVDKINDIILHLQKILNPTNKAYWVCPLIEGSEALDDTAVKERFIKLEKHFGYRVGLLHGKMRPLEKEVIMNEFKNGNVDLLVSTTVIEVGVDVKTANIMIIEHAESFGLAQLHQLRGRVGRSHDQAHCLLLYHKLFPIAKERLKAMRDSNDGFYLAEMDLKIRGGGDVLGLVQSGQKPFRFYKGEQPHRLQCLLRRANADAIQLINDDPELTSERGQAIRELLKIFQKENILSVLRSG